MGMLTSEVYFDDCRDSFNGSRAERIARRKQLNAAREKLAQNMKEGKYAPDSVENKLLVELRRQKKDGGKQCVFLFIYE
jgi:hypothetical protein